MKKILALAVLASLMTSACANPDGTYGSTGSSSPINKQNVGALGGAVIGGVLGSQVGGGSGRLWATGAGAVLGGLAGSEIGKSLDRADQAYMNQAYNKAMTAPAGQNITWSNPDSGNSGSYNTIRTGRDNSSGGMCREYQQTIKVGGKTEQGVGTACQNADGSWQIVNN